MRTVSPTGAEPCESTTTCCSGDFAALDAGFALAGAALDVRAPVGFGSGTSPWPADADSVRNVLACRLPTIELVLSFARKKEIKESESKSQLVS